MSCIPQRGHLHIISQVAQAEDALDRIKAIKRTEKDLARNKVKTREDIIRWQEKVDNPPKHEALDPISDEMVVSLLAFVSTFGHLYAPEQKVLRTELLEIRVKRNELKTQMEALAEQNAIYSKTIDDNEDQ